jgi:TPP-dependent pyruvate/acetoin dehydrogenase alpha subunit
VISVTRSRQAFNSAAALWAKATLRRYRLPDQLRARILFGIAPGGACHAGPVVPVFVADGADFFAVHEAAGKAIAHARAGNGPAGVFAEQGRYHGHFVGDPQAYRAEGELEDLRENHCPLKNFRARMAETGELSEAELDAIDAEVMAEIEQSVTDAKAAARPTAEQVTEDVYIQYTATA